MKRKKSTFTEKRVSLLESSSNPVCITQVSSVRSQFRLKLKHSLDLFSALTPDSFA